MKYNTETFNDSRCFNDLINNLYHSQVNSHLKSMPGRTNVFPLVAGSCVVGYRSVVVGIHCLLATSHQGFSCQMTFHQAEWLLGASYCRWFLPAGVCVSGGSGLVAGSYL